MVRLHRMGWGLGLGLVIDNESVSFTAPFGWALVPGPGPRREPPQPIELVKCQDP